MQSKSYPIMFNIFHFNGRKKRLFPIDVHFMQNNAKLITVQICHCNVINKTIRKQNCFKFHSIKKNYKKTECHIFCLKVQNNFEHILFMT